MYDTMPDRRRRRHPVPAQETADALDGFLLAGKRPAFGQHRPAAGITDREFAVRIADLLGLARQQRLGPLGIDTIQPELQG
jgi:hypothetical protein